MNKIIILFFCLFLHTLDAQYKIKGAFLNEKSIPQKNIVVKLLNSKDSLLIKSTLSNNYGSFLITDINSGNYILSYLDKSNRINYKNILIEKMDIDIGNITFYSQIDIEEVKIISKKPLFEPKLDKIIVNVQENLNFAGGTVLEVLSRSPGISINREKNSISLNGKEGVLIMIDGKLSRIPADALMQMLEGMPSQGIDKIEIITNPSSKYDSGSTGGIINVIGLKEKKDGLNGSYSLIGGWGGKERVGVTGNINYGKGKLNLYSNFAYYRNHNKQTYIIDREVFSMDKYLNHVVTERDPLSDYFTSKIGIDYYYTEKTQIGGYATVMTDIFNLKANTITKNVVNDISSSVLTHNLESNNWSSLNLNGYFNQKIMKTQELNFDFSYLHFYNTNNLTNFNSYYNNNSQLNLFENLDGHKNAPINTWIGKLDYSITFSEKNKLEFGMKETFSDYRNSINVKKNEILDHLLTQVFKLTENIFGLYGNFIKKIDSKTNMQIGIRYEKFDLKSQSTLTGLLGRHSGDFFPSFFLSHDLNNSNTLQISYSRRVERPAYNDFAPYYVFFDPSTSLTGNTKLNQSLINIYKLDFKHNKTLITFQYSRDKNGISRFQPLLNTENNTLFFTTLNMKYKDQYFISISSPMKIAKWFNIQNSLMIGRQIFRTQDLPIDLTLKNNFIKFNSTFTFNLPKDIIMELSGFYHTPELYGISKNKEFGNLNIAFSRKMNENNKLVLSMNNVLCPYKDWDIVDYSELNYSVNPEYTLSPFIIRLTFTHNFGKNNSNLKGRKESGAEEMNNRIR